MVSYTTCFVFFSDATKPSPAGVYSLGLSQWLSTGVNFTTQGHLTMSGDVIGHHKSMCMCVWGEGVGCTGI